MSGLARYWFVLLIAVVSVFAQTLSAAEPLRPNIIWIMADDLGYGDLGCYGQQLIKTPHLDQLAKDGMKFTQFYAGATVCAPSRSVLMSGQHQGHTRVRGNGGGLKQALRENDITVAKVLQSAGYKTALIGKWGLGDVGDAEVGLPRKQGFDYFYGFLNQTHAHNHFPSFLWRNEERVQLENDLVASGDTGAGHATKPVEYADDLFAEEALRFVSENREKPFFLYWSMVIPHANNERTKSLGNGTEVPDLGEYKDMKWPDADKGQAAMIARMDSYVGRMVAKLKELQLDQRTLVIFTSDNGPHNESKHTPTLFKPAGPLRGMKRSLTDGGIRVPFIASWSGKIKADSENTHVGYFGDLMATAVELSGAKMPDGCNSLSFAPALLGAGEQQQHEFLYWEFHEGGFKQAALYQGRWKAIRSGTASSTPILYDLKNDLSEQNNVADKNPEIVKKLVAYLDTARRESPDWVPAWQGKKGMK
jgi:arylsulfatase A-like enzyme